MQRTRLPLRLLLGLWVSASGLSAQALPDLVCENTHAYLLQNGELVEQRSPPEVPWAFLTPDFEVDGETGLSVMVFKPKTVLVANRGKLVTYAVTATDDRGGLLNGFLTTLEILPIEDAAEPSLEAPFDGRRWEFLLKGSDGGAIHTGICRAASPGA